MLWNNTASLPRLLETSWLATVNITYFLDLSIICCSKKELFVEIRWKDGQATKWVWQNYSQLLVSLNHLSNYKVVQIWPGLIVCKQVTVCPGHIWTTLYSKYLFLLDQNEWAFPHHITFWNKTLLGLSALKHCSELSSTAMQFQTLQSFEMETAHPWIQQYIPEDLNLRELSC
jgi:hypothetical protein